MSPDLEQIRREAERVTRAFSQHHWHRAPQGKWSCAQILEHLRLSYAATTLGVQKVMFGGEPLPSKPTVQEKLRIFAVTGLGYLLPGRKSPKNLTPKAALDSLPPFNDALVAMDATLADAEKRFGSKVQLLDHPFIGPLNVQQWRRFHRVHTRKHLKQMSRRAREAESLPALEDDLTKKNLNTTATQVVR